MAKNRTGRPQGEGLPLAQPPPPQSQQDHTKKTVRVFGATPKAIPQALTRSYAPITQPTQPYQSPNRRYATYARKPKKGIKTHQGLTKGIFCVSRGGLKWVCELRKILPPNLKKFINDLQKGGFCKYPKINELNIISL